jgi:hypothetical protein
MICDMVLVGLMKNTTYYPAEDITMFDAVQNSLQVRNTQNQNIHNFNLLQLTMLLLQYASHKGFEEFQMSCQYYHLADLFFRGRPG